MKYLLVVAICVGVFVVSQIIPQSDDERFYLINSSWSLLVIFSVTFIQRTRTVIAVCIIESIITVVNLITCIDYLNGKGSPYAVYPTIINSLNATEALVLLIGAPWIGAYNRLAAVAGNLPFINKRYHRLISSLSKRKAVGKKDQSVDKGVKR